MITRRTALSGALAMAATPSFAAGSGWVVPPEEGPHEATLMMWPVNRRVHPDAEFLDILQDTIAEITSAIAEFEPIYLMAHPDDWANARARVSARVTLWDIPTEDLWARDAGPLFTKNAQGARAVSHIQFNGWGKKQVHARDSKVAAAVASRMGVDLMPTGLFGEAGGVEHDGHGLLMAHESFWVIGNRNPSLSRDQLEERLLKTYGANKMIWSKGVRDQDITDYHIDSLARFTGPNTVLINLPDDPDPYDDFHQAALQTYDVLEAAGLNLTVIPEPAPRARRIKSEDFVASYANFYACNGAVIAAQFGDKEADTIAAKALATHYSGREIITLDVDALGEVGGGIHCATQQIPV